MGPARGELCCEPEWPWSPEAAGEPEKLKEPEAPGEPVKPWGLETSPPA